MLKTVSLYLMVILYVGAGINHFMHPDFYLRIIPGYLPAHSAINILSGVAELALGLFLLFEQTRKLAANGIIILLILFIPAHISMIQDSGCGNREWCTSTWLAWIRLFPFQFLLIAWAYRYRK